MHTHLLKPAGLTEPSAGLGTVTRKLVQLRAIELAVVNGHLAKDVSQSDWEQARRELTGGPASDSKVAGLESTAETEGWNRVVGPVGNKAPTAGNANEDANLTTGGLAAIKDVAAKATWDAGPLKESLASLSAEFKGLGLSMSGAAVTTK